ncbi:hypothetical protein ScPMuIL_016806 [Solemya velum]
MYPLNFLSSEKTMVKSLYGEEDNDMFSERLRKTLYYGKSPKTDRPSMPVTEIAVEFFQEAAPRELDKISTMFASQTSRHACMSPCSIMLAILYVKRLRERNPEYLQRVSSSDLFFISVMMASKFLYDEGVDEEVFNDEWAESGNMEIDDVNRLEREFLSAADWKLYVRPEDFSDVLKSMEKRIAWDKGVDRGWFSYTDLFVLSQDPQWSTLWLELTKDLTQVVIVSSVAYLAAVLTMVGSTAIVMTLSPAIVAHGPISILPPEIPSLASPNVPILELSPELLNTQDSAERPDIGPQPFSRTDSIISQLLAVVTLKNSFVQFLYALQDQSNKSHPRTSAEHTASSTNCRPQLYSEYQCYNVTTGEVVQRPVCCGECGCQQDVESDTDFNQMKLRLCDGLSCYGPGYDVMCCDRHRLRLTEEGYNFHPFPDLWTGSTTSSHWLSAAA